MSVTPSSVVEGQNCRILALPKYDCLAASARHRYFAIEGYLSDAGIVVKYSPLLDDRYLHGFLQNGKKSLGRLLSGYWNRLTELRSACEYDLLWIHFEALPYLPAWVEILLTSGTQPYVLDFDDALFHQYDQHNNLLVRKVLGGKIPELVRRAAGVIAGNEYIADMAERAGCRRVAVIPTVVDLNRYDRIKQHNNRRGQVRVGWMGSRSTAAYLGIVEPVLTELQRAGEISGALVVGAAGLQAGGQSVSHRPWREETEVDDLMDMDIGIMPLRDSPWERGKCGFKLIQYMACGLPVVASPVGVNRKIVQHGANGFLAESNEEWREALKILAGDPLLRQVMGEMGRERVKSDFSLQKTAPRLVEFLKECAAS